MKLDPEELERFNVEVIIVTFANAIKRKKNSFKLNLFYSNFYKEKK